MKREIVNEERSKDNMHYEEHKERSILNIQKIRKDMVTSVRRSDK